MKSRHVAVNILTWIPAFLLTVVLIVCLLATCLYHVVINTISADTINELTKTTVTELVQSPDFETMILENEVVQQHIEQLEISTEAVGELMQSEAADEVINLLSSDFSNLLTGAETEVQFTPEALVGIVKDHAGELAAIAGETMDIPLTEEDLVELETQIVETVEQNAENLATVMPDVEELRTTVVEDVGIGEYLSYLNHQYLNTMYIVCAVLALLIFALRCYRFGGFLWWGVSATLAGLLLGLLHATIHTLVSPQILSNLGQAQGTILTLYDHILSSVSKTMWICLGAAVVCFVAFALLYNLVVKKRIAADGINDPAVQVDPLCEVTAPDALPETAVPDTNG